MILVQRHTRALLTVLLAAGLLLIAVPAASARGCERAGAEPTQASHRQLVRATVCLLNVERRKRGMRPLRLSRRLGQAARGHSVDMARRGYFSHNSRSGASFLDRIRRAGYLRGARSWRVGENIAWGTGSLATPRAIVRAWMKSPGHRANILNRSFRQIGIGISPRAPVSVAGRSAGTYTTDFGARS